MLRQFFVLISSAISATIIPIHFNERNRPFVSNVTLSGPEASNATIHVMVTLQPRSYSAFDSEVMSQLVSGRELLLGGSYSFDVGSIHGPLLHRTYDRDIANLVRMGIGRGGRLLTRHNAISVLRNETSRSGLLILGDADSEQFNRSCVPGSIASSPIVHRTHPLSAVWANPVGAVQSRLILPTGQEIVDTTRDVLSVDCEPTLPTPKMLSLPPALDDEISRIILESGAVRNEQNPYIVSNCTYGSLIDQLPQIKLSLRHTGAELIFFPEDYVHFNPDTTECVLNYYRSTDETSPLKFNPLAVPNMNLHISNDVIRICDAL